MPTLPSSNHPEPGNREANDLGDAQMSRSERSPDIGNADDDKTANLISYTERIESYSGPLPNPAMLRDYEELYPKATELLFDQFFKVTEHNMLMETNEREAIDKDREAARQVLFRGQLIAAILGLGCMAVAIILAFNGNEAWAAGVALSSITILAGKFITSHLIKRESSAGRGS